MNFFAHCVLAARAADDAAFGLGSMLPDFATMSGGRLLGSAHDAVQRGVAHHHATDAVFHSAPTFVDLCRRSAERLEHVHVRWGTARAVAHVGVELLLDGWLLHRTPARIHAHYHQALRRAAPDDLGSTLRWRHPQTAARFERLRRRLIDYGLPEDLGTPAVVFARLRRALDGRPRLRIEDRDATAVRAELDHLAAEVEDDAARLMREVTEGLARAAGAS